MIQTNKRYLMTALLLLVLLLTSQTAHPFTRYEYNQSLEIPLPAHDLGQGSDQKHGVHGQAQKTVEMSLAARFGGQWRVHSWNRWTETPHFVYGTAPTVVNGSCARGEFEAVGRRIIEQNRDVLRADPENLRLAATPAGARKRALHYQQTYHGLDVWQGLVRVVISDTGKLVLMGSDYYADIRLDPLPTLSADIATGIACSALPFNQQTDRLDGQAELLVLPVHVTETRVEHHLVWRLRVRTADPLGIWVSHVDAHSGEIIWRYNDIHFSFAGDTQSDTQPVSYCDGVAAEAMPWLYLDVDGLPQVASDADGNWQAAGDGQSRTVTSRLVGPYVDVYRNHAGPLASFSGIAQSGVPLQVYFDDLNAQRDERDVFDGVNDIHDFFQLFAPEFPFCHEPMLAEVSINDYCNAYWDGDIHFFRTGGGCYNSGEVQSVVQHEYGHGIQAAILGCQGNEGLGEGNADVMAILITQDPVIGRGLLMGDCVNGIRTADNSLIYPNDVVGQPIHYAGRVIAGFHWDAMQGMQARYGTGKGTLQTARDWHYGRILLHPMNQPDQVLATILANDDDGDLTNGTPDEDIYCMAATNHNFDCPGGIVFIHEEHLDTTEIEDPYQITVRVQSTVATIDPATVRLFWRLDADPWYEVAMNHDEGHAYSSLIPAQENGTISYYVLAEDVTGTSGSFPVGAPANSCSFHVAWHIDNAEQADGWTVGAPDDAATNGIWEHCDPVGLPGQPEDDHSTVGTMCWITGQFYSGPIYGSDVDGGKTTLFSPVYDLTGASNVVLRYWKWYSNIYGSYPGSDRWSVYLSNDAGQSWTRVEYTTVSTDRWEEKVLYLSSLFPEPGQLQFRFEATDNIYDSHVEAGVDDLLIQAEFAATAVDGTVVTARVKLGQNYPNPFNPVTEISFNLVREGWTSLKIFDIKGRLIRTMIDSHLAAGLHQVSWNGKDQAGTQVPSGIYFYRLRTAGQTLSQRMVLAK